MPELPEVETVLRSIRSRLFDRTIVAARFHAPRAALYQADRFAARLTGRRIQDVQRQGKHILFRLDQGWLDIHLRMTGKLLWGTARPKYLRATLELDNGDTLQFEDVRQFGYLRWSENLPQLGPDALGLKLDEFAALLRGRRGRIKPLLLNQARLAGLGNIYVDEALFRSRIHPLAQTFRLSRARLARLHAAVQAVLEEAIAAGGSSISDYVDAAGTRGSFQNRHKVYGREGQPCMECGTPIRRIVVGQRGTNYCPRCQHP